MDTLSKYLKYMTNIGITPKNNIESWKKHLKWWTLLFIENRAPIKWTNLVEFLEKEFRTKDANLIDGYFKDVDTKNTDFENSDSKNADSKDANSKNADSKDFDFKHIDPLSFYFNDLKKHARPLLNREQEFWLAIDIQAGLRISQAISSDGISGVYSDLSDNWNQFSTMIESLRLPSIDWDRAVSVMAQQRVDKERVRFSEIFPWLESVNDHTEVRQKISRHVTQIYLDLIILPVSALLMFAGNFARDDFTFQDGNEIDHWFTADPTIEWPKYEIFTQANQAKKQLISSNLRLVVSIAKKYRGRGVEFADLIQQGNLGLIHTIYKYDPSKGNKFSTYAPFWIRKEIRSYIADNSRLISLSDNVSEKRYQVYQARERLDQQLHRLQTADEIAEALDLTTTAEVANLLEFDIKTIKCDEHVDESDDYVLEDIIEELDPIDQVHVADLHCLTRDIKSVLNTLSTNQRNVIKLRFGFDGQERTNKEVGDALGLSEKRIRKLEDAALKYLRYPARSNLLRKYLESIQE